jgi:hypothetical protein
MKKLLLLATFALITASAFAQGTVNFANVGGGAPGSVNAPVTLSTTGAKLDGAAWLAQLYWAPAGVSDPNSSSLVALTGSAPGTFNSGAQAGYFTAGQRTFPVAGGTVVSIQVRAWNAAAGATYEAASGSAAGITGKGNVIQYTLGTPPATPNNLVGLTAFTVSPVPEPSSIALGLLGLGAVALFRRRK